MTGRMNDMTFVLPSDIKDTRDICGVTRTIHTSASLLFYRVVATNGATAGSLYL